MTQNELNELYDKIYDLKAGETLELTSQGGLRYVITKDSLYQDKESYRRDDPELTDEELSDPDFGNLVTIEAFEGDKFILNSEDVHVIDLDVEALYEDETSLFDEQGEEITGKEWLSLEEEKEV